MSRLCWRATMAALVSTGLAGCAHVAPRAAFDDVETLVAARGAPAPRWHRDEASTAAVEQRIAELLGPPLTLDGAVEIALLNNRSLQAAFEDLGIAQAEVVQAAKLENPVLFGSPRFSDRAGTNLDLGITQNLLQLLVRPARKRLAGAQLEEVQLSVADEVLHLAAEAQRTYFEVVGAQQVRDMRALVSEAAEGSFDLARRIHAAGNLSDLALATERAMFEEARVVLAKSEVELRRTREALTRVLGLWGPAVAFTAVSRLPELPAEEPPLDSLESMAIDRRLDLAAAIQSVEVAATALGITRNWRYLLTAEIGVSAERETDGEWLIGPELSIELPIFDQRQAAIAEHEARFRQRAARMAALAVDIRSEVRELRDQLLMTRDLATHYRQVIIPLREQIVALTEEQYNYMLIGAFELLLAKQSEYDAYRDYIESVRDYWITRVSLTRAVGGSLEPGTPGIAIETPTTTPPNETAHEGHQGMTP